MSDALPPLEELRRKIAASRKREAPATKPSRALRGANSYGYVADLLAGFAVGTGLGYFADGKFGTLPVFTVVGLILGSAAGVLLIYKASQREDAPTANGGEAGEK